MTRVARRGAMLHHHVPEPKETSPLVHRLRLELNRTVRRRVTEAVDAVCVAFEDELTLLTTPKDVKAEINIDSYEQFYDYCSRLTKFIANTMDTTPGFLEQMDRVIFACHYNATGPTLMKDLRIRRRGKNNGEVEIKTEPLVTNDHEQPVISPPNGRIEKLAEEEEVMTSDKVEMCTGDEEVFSGGELEKSATDKAASRQWRKRKRLSTGGSSATKQVRVKRVKRSLGWERNSNGSDEKERKQDVGGDETLQRARVQTSSERASRRDKCIRRLVREFEDVQEEHFVDKEKEEARGWHFVEREVESGRSSGEEIQINRVRILSRAAKRASRRDKGIGQQVGEFKDVEEEQLLNEEKEDTQEKHFVESKEREEAGKNERDKRMRWNLRSLSKNVNSSSEPNDIDEGEQREARTTEGEKTQAVEDLLGQNVNTMVESDLSATAETTSENGVISKGEEVDTSKQEAEPQNEAELIAETNVSSEANGKVENKKGGCNVTGMEDEAEIVVASAGAFVANDGEEIQASACDENMGEPGHIQQAETVSVSDDLEDTAAQNDGASVDTAITHDTPGEDKRKMSYEEALVTRDKEAKDTTRGVSETLPESQQEGATYTIVPPNLGSTVGSPGSCQAESPESDHEPPVPGLCDAGMRPPQQVRQFKACLRKSIQVVDATLCLPPPGKRCSRNCEKIRSGKCVGGVCRDRLCRNWHKTEAHTDRCENPLCEFGSRIKLREYMHQVANQDVQTKLLQSQWEERCVELVMAEIKSSTKQYTHDEVAKLEEDIDQLWQSYGDSKKKTEELKKLRSALLVTLTWIGVKPEDDAADGFPDFDTHYV